MEAGTLLFSRDRLYRVVASGEDHITVIEQADLSEASLPIIWSKIKDEYYQWNKGLGTKVTFKKVGVISPQKTITRIHDFSQLRSFDSIVIKGTPYKFAENDGSREVPAKMQGHTVFYLSKNDKQALLSIEKLERQSLMDKAAHCFFYEGGKISQLVEADIWLVSS